MGEHQDVAGIHFKPWIGRKYGKAGLFRLRVMILGESHYKWHRRVPVTPEFTRDRVNEQISGEETKAFWTNIAIALIGRKPTLREKGGFWESVAFSNFIQEPVGYGARRPPSDRMWADGRALFGKLVSRCKPDVVVVLGYRVWIHLPDCWGHEGPLLRGARYDETWIYPHSRGSALAFGIRHPSSGFSGTTWHAVVRRGLKLAESQ